MNGNQIFFYEIDLLYSNKVQILTLTFNTKESINFSSALSVPFVGVYRALCTIEIGPVASHKNYGERYRQWVNLSFYLHFIMYLKHAII